MFTIPCEAILNRHPRVYRSALVGVGPRGSQQPVIVAEAWPSPPPFGSNEQYELRDELIALAASHALTQSIKTVLIIDSLPVDIRHNSKIFREQVAEWAAQRMMS
jgi:acyl-coenzyme A synthetase/AMP-(fatty) acid ligase